MTNINSYTVFYKNSTQWFWRKIKNVVSDGFIEYKIENALICKDSRYFELTDGTRREISTIGVLFKFSNERAIIEATKKVPR